MNRRDFQILAHDRQIDARVLLDNRRYAAAYYLCGYVIDGRYLIEALKTSGFQLQNAYWWYLAESRRWVLMISADFVKAGPSKAYEVVQTALANLYNESAALSPLEYVYPFSISLEDVGVVRPDDFVASHIQLLINRNEAWRRPINRQPLPPRNQVMRLGATKFAVPGIRLTQLVAFGVYIDDAFIYLF